MQPYEFPLARHGGKIAFQGRVGAYSHLAAGHCYPNYLAKPYEQFADVFRAVAFAETDLAIIPIQNSLGGRVADIHLLLPKTELFIIAEHFQKIEHCLLIPNNSDLKNITEVYSHPQALAQCRGNLQKYQLRPMQFFDTAAAAEWVARKDAPKHVAAIASRQAALVYDLTIVKENFEDAANNVTRFLILSSQQIIPETTNGTIITALIFSLKSLPAALYKCLGGFASNGINILKLESYIPMNLNRHNNQDDVAEFYIEFEGSVTSPNVEQALKELAYFSHVRQLGCFVKNYLA